MEPTSHLIYPSLQQPVLTDAQRPEATSVDRYHRHFSEPVRHRIAPRLIIALMAASGTAPIDPVALTQAEAVSIDKWQQPLSEPKRFRPALHVSSQPAAFLVKADPFGENVNLDKWYARFSEPVRQPKALKAHLQRPAFLTQAAPFGENVNLDKWYAPLSDPMRRIEYRQRVAPSVAFLNVEIFDVPFEDIFVSKWFQPLSDPTRRRGIRVEYIPAAIWTFRADPPTEPVRLSTTVVRGAGMSTGISVSAKLSGSLTGPARLTTRITRP